MTTIERQRNRYSSQVSTMSHNTNYLVFECYRELEVRVRWGLWLLLGHLVVLQLLVWQVPLGFPYDS
jgi:hypothetical protein